MLIAAMSPLLYLITTTASVSLEQSIMLYATLSAQIREICSLNTAGVSKKE